MLVKFDEVSGLINEGKLLHIAGTEELIKKLPKGNWIGGSTEYFMAESGGKVSGELLFVTELPFKNFSFKSYTHNDIKNVAADAYDNGFTIVILPFNSAVHKEYAENAAGFAGMFIKTIAGWVSGINLEKSGQTPVAANGIAGEVYTDKAVALHLEVSAGKSVNLNIINIFEQDEASPVIEFTQEGFSITNCLVDGKETVFADYLTQNDINTQLPLVGDYSGSGVNISIKSIENGVVNLYSSVFSGIQYRVAKDVTDYAGAFNAHLVNHKNVDAVFSCNCILNFLYGGFEGKSINAFTGPITFGEVAYQLLNQTLVYVTVSS